MITCRGGACLSHRTHVLLKYECERRARGGTAPRTSGVWRNADEAAAGVRARQVWSFWASCASGGQRSSGAILCVARGRQAAGTERRAFAAERAGYRRTEISAARLLPCVSRKRAGGAAL